MISQANPSTTLTLVATGDDGSTHHHEMLPNQGFFVGKSSNCRLQLGGDGLSDIHCRIEFDNGKIWVQDWMSAEGTRINGETITTKVDLQADDSIQIGRYRLQLSSGTSQEKTIQSHPPAQSGGQDWQRSEVDPLNVSQEDSTLSPHETPTTLQQDSHHVEKLPIKAVDDSDTVTDELKSMDPNVDFFQFEEEATYDRETVVLLHAEIEALQTALAQRDAECYGGETGQNVTSNAVEDSDTVLERMQELIDEANRSDERVAILEEMLFVAEESNRSQQDERNQLEAWVADIENRIGRREHEHQAEIDALRERINESNLQRDRLQKQLQLAAGSGNAPECYEETLENLQKRNRELQEKLEESENERLALDRRHGQLSTEHQQSLRTERVSLAQEKAKVSRMRFELSNKLSDIEEMPKTDKSLDSETALKIQTLREHLREIHEQEKQEAKEASIATRLAKLWKRVEY